MRLFMFIAIADSSIFCNQFFAFMTCKLYLPELLIWTVKWEQAVPQTMVLALKKIFVASNFWEIFWMVTSLQLNMSLCLDLILMIKYPFVNKESRMNFYIFGSISIAFVFGIVNVGYLNTA